MLAAALACDEDPPMEESSALRRLDSSARLLRSSSSRCCSEQPVPLHVEDLVVRHQLLASRVLWEDRTLGYGGHRPVPGLLRDVDGGARCFAVSSPLGVSPWMTAHRSGAGCEA